MAIFYQRVHMISRGAGRSAVGAAAYRAGEKHTNEYDGQTHDYRNRRNAAGAAAYRSGEHIDGYDFTNREDIIHSEIILPPHAPKEYQNRSVLWNAVEQSEKNSNARLAREIVVALPVELTPEQNIELVRDYVRRNFVADGMCADYSFHAGHKHTKEDEEYPFKDLTIQKDNPHAHIMLTVRPLNQDGAWGAKSRKEYILNESGNKIKLPSGEWKSRKIPSTDWDRTETLLKWREDWARTVNKEFERLGIDERIDHRSYERRCQGYFKFIENICNRQKQWYIEWKPHFCQNKADVRK